MLKKILSLVFSAGSISALLLFAGTTLMSQWTPAFASSLPALVAGASIATHLPAVQVDAEVSPILLSAAPGVTGKVDPNSLSTSLAPLSAPNSGTITQMKSAPQSIPAANVTINQLLAKPENFRKQIIAVTGITTVLDHEKVLINDGTGQIIIELDKSMGKFTISNGSTVTFSGLLNRLSENSSSYKIIACAASSDPTVTGCSSDFTDPEETQSGAVIKNTSVPQGNPSTGSGTDESKKPSGTGDSTDHSSSSGDGSSSSGSRDGSHDNGGDHHSGGD